MHERRRQLGGYLPSWVLRPFHFEAPPLGDFAEWLAGSKGRSLSAMMGFVTMLRHLLKDQRIGKFIVPIIADEARTFGMEPIIRQVGIYASQGQKYEPRACSCITGRRRTAGCWKEASRKQVPWARSWLQGRRICELRHPDDPIF